MTELAGLLHKLSDSLREAAREADRGDDNAAAETIEKASAEIREELEQS